MTFPDWILANGANLQAVLYVTLLVVLLVAERVAPRRAGPMDRKPRWTANFGLTLLNFLAMGLIPLSLVGAAFLARERGWGLLNQVALPTAAVVAVTLLARSFIAFFIHYALHRVPLLWRMHRVHHLDTEMDVSTTIRVHPLEFVLGAFPGIPIVLAFGLAPWAIVLYELFNVVVPLWSHSNLRVPTGLNRLMRYVIVTPDLHRVHHSTWQPETNSNFSTVFPVWDLVFGTFRAESRDGAESMRLGQDEVRGRDAHRLLWLLGSVTKKQLRPGERERPEARRRLWNSRRSRPAMDVIKAEVR